MSEEVAAAFVRFYEELHSCDQRPEPRPYDWQIRAATELAAGNVFDALEAPTGSGKTTLIECFVFALAWQAQAGEPVLPRRLFWVVDRRAVVDQVFAHAEQVADRIQKATEATEALASVKRRLHELAGVAPTDSNPALHVARWRGGVAFERLTLSPVLPAVICSTVDQVGSRLLFRGYGTSPRSRPLEAALTGTDSLIVLDEAHIAGPFLDTAQAIRAHQARASETLRKPLAVAPISATLPDDTRGSVFRLTLGELDQDELKPRYQASKRTRLVKGTNRVTRLITEAKKLAQGNATVVGVIANTVVEAREIHKGLAHAGATVLIIGPSRSLERDTLLGRIPARALRNQDDEPLFVVATQTIEVGLDLDFDALATAAAPFQALAQRFGRLDRAGVLGESQAVVVHGPKPEPVYAETATDTFKWLAGRAADGIIDLGPSQLKMLADQDPPAPPRPPLAPILLPHHIEALAQTSQEPFPSPEIGYFLHGEEGARVADVQICWRADLASQGSDDEWTERVLARPPHSGELISLPVWGVRSWLRGFAEVNFADIESSSGEPEVRVRAGDVANQRFVRVPPPDPDGRLNAAVVRRADEIRPGDVIVVPSQIGGATEFGWDPTSTKRVTDLGNLAPIRPRILVDPNLPILENGRGALPDALADIARELVAQITAETLTEDPYTELWEALTGWADVDHDQGAAARVRRGILAGLSPSGEVLAVPASDPTALVLRPLTEKSTSKAAPPISFADHTRRVVELSKHFATGCGFDERTANTLVLAAEYHDAGKLDPRFQAWLNGGAPIGAGKPLAKSAVGLASISWRAAARAAGWPVGKRHENISALLLRRVLAESPDPSIDEDLAIHLVATHHGQSRPFLSPEPSDLNPVEVDFEALGTGIVLRSDEEIPWAEHVNRYCRLCDRFGEWGLARFEAALVSADRLASAEVPE